MRGPAPPKVARSLIRIKPWLVKNYYPLLAGGLSLLGSVPLLLSSQTVPGYDASSHVAKTAFLIYSFSHGNFSGWSEFWYSGFQMLYTYSPLTYILGAGLGIFLGGAARGMGAVVASSFVLSGLGVFSLARKLGVPRYWALVSSLLYSLASPHVLILFYDGSLTYALAFALLPWVLLSVELALQKPGLRSAAALGAAIALLVFSNATTAYVAFFPLFAYVVIRVAQRGSLKPLLVVLASVGVGLLFSAFWLLPYLEADLSGQLDLLTESATGAYPVPNVIHWYSFFTPDFPNMIGGDVGWLLLLPALGSALFLRRREEWALFGAGVVAALMSIGPSLAPAFYRIPLVLALQFAWRFLIADLIFLAPLAAIFFWRAWMRLQVRAKWSGGTKRALAFSAVAVLIIAQLASSVPAVASTFTQGQLTPSDPGTKGALDFLARQPGFFRVMAIDRYYESFPEFTLKGSIDGWYDQATTQAYRNFTFNIYYCTPNERALGGLRLLGARYVLIESGTGGDVAKALGGYNSTISALGPPVFDDGRAAIYQVPNSSLIYVTSSVPNSGFGLSQDVNCNAPIPSAPTKQVNYTLSNLEWGEASISFDVRVNQSAYVLVSNSYAPGWGATDNGTSVRILTSPPGLPVIGISPGTNRVVLRYASSETDRLSAVLSLVSLLGVSSALVLDRRFRPASSRIA
jgi:hypothetical protein